MFLMKTPTHVFSHEICENFKGTYFEEHLRTTVSEFSYFIQINIPQYAHARRTSGQVKQQLYLATGYYSFVESYISFHLITLDSTFSGV